jgi:hypothetical protein
MKGDFVGRKPNVQALGFFSYHLIDIRQINQAEAYHGTPTENYSLNPTNTIRLKGLG